MTIINKHRFQSGIYSLERIIKILKEKGCYYKCRICGKKFVKTENTICDSCKYLASLKITNQG